MEKKRPSLCRFGVGFFGQKKWSATGPQILVFTTFVLIGLHEAIMTFSSTRPANSWRWTCMIQTSGQVGLGNLEIWEWKRGHHSQCSSPEAVWLYSFFGIAMITHYDYCNHMWDHFQDILFLKNVKSIFSSSDSPHLLVILYIRLFRWIIATSLRLENEHSLEGMVSKMTNFLFYLYNSCNLSGRIYLSCGDAWIAMIPQQTADFCVKASLPGFWMPSHTHTSCI